MALSLPFFPHFSPILTALCSPGESAGEAAKYGIMFDDREYDYTQHLKEMGAAGAVFIDGPKPKSAAARSSAASVVSALDAAESRIARLGLTDLLASEFEDEVGMLNRGEEYIGPQPQLPDDVREVLEALADAENIEEEEAGDLDDDFIALADGDDLDGSDFYDDEDEEWDDNDSMRAQYSDDEDGHVDDGFMSGIRDNALRRRELLSGRLTSASFSSSVLPRSELMQALDDRFDTVMEQYDEDAIGELNEEDAEVLGASNVMDFEDVLDEFIAKHEADNIRGASLLTHISILAPPGEESAEVNEGEAIEPNLNRPSRVRFHLPPKDGEGDDEEEDQVMPQMGGVMEDRWDCDSILSTYSNMDNHPGVILDRRVAGAKPAKVIRIGRSGIPIGAFRNMALATAQKKAAAAAAAAAESGAKSGVKMSDVKSDVKSDADVKDDIKSDADAENKTKSGAESDVKTLSDAADATSTSADATDADAADVKSDAADAADGNSDASDSDDGAGLNVVPGFRAKGETAEERRARKKATKAEARDRRAAKKNTKVAFKQEKMRQEKEQIANRMSSAVLL